MSRAVPQQLDLEEAIRRLQGTVIRPYTLGLPDETEIDLECTGDYVIEPGPDLSPCLVFEETDGCTFRIPYDAVRWVRRHPEKKAAAKPPAKVVTLATTAKPPSGEDPSGGF